MKKGLLASTALLTLLVATPALAEHHDHSGGTQEGGATATTGGTANGATGGTHHHRNGTFGKTAGGSAGGGSSGAGVIVTSGSGGAVSTGDTHHQVRFGRGNPLTGSAGGSSGSGTVGSGETGGPHRDRGTSAVVNNPFTGNGGTTDRNAAGGFNHDPGTRFNNGVTVFAPHTHWGRSDHNSAFDALRRALNASHRFRHGTYNRPNGWYAHNWRYGEFLPYVFFSQQYWVGDWQDFGLDEPPPGTVWVRYGNDALLTDVDTGEVIEAVYGLFY